jgi:hypothetical protein
MMGKESGPEVMSESNVAVQGEVDKEGVVQETKGTGLFRWSRKDRSATETATRAVLSASLPGMRSRIEGRGKTKIIMLFYNRIKKKIL